LIIEPFAEVLNKADKKLRGRISTVLFPNHVKYIERLGLWYTLCSRSLLCAHSPPCLMADRTHVRNATQRNARPKEWKSEAGAEEKTSRGGAEKEEAVVEEDGEDDEDEDEDPYLVNSNHNHRHAVDSDEDDDADDSDEEEEEDDDDDDDEEEIHSD
jgi:hypothetical protein